MHHDWLLAGAAAHLVLDAFNHIDNVVAKFLSFANDVHIENAGLVFVFLVVDTLDVLAAQNVSVIVDFALLVEVLYQVGFVHLFDVAQQI